MGKKWNIFSVVLVVHDTYCWLFKLFPPRTLLTAHDSINLGVGGPEGVYSVFWGVFVLLLVTLSTSNDAVNLGVGEFL